jgi:hypothetical protein
VKLSLHHALLLTLLLGGALAAAPELTPSNNGSEVRCDSSAVINQATATTTQLVALSSGKKVYVCSALVNQVGAATAPTFKFVYGTGTNCVTGTTDLTGVITGGAASTATNVQFGGNGLGYVFATPASQALCITTTTTQAQKGLLSYTQF